LRTLCFNLRVNYQDLPGDARADKARELIEYLERHDSVHELVRVGTLLRPDITWETPFSPVPPQPKEYAVTDPDLLIAKHLHWDREEPAKNFLGMIKRKKEYPYEFLILQAPKQADLDSLVKRFYAMCEGLKSKTTPPLLYARIKLAKGFAAPESLARKILHDLADCAARYEGEQVRRQAERLQRAQDGIESGIAGDRLSQLTPSQLTRALTQCHQEMARECTVVLLLSDFEEVLNDRSGTWLKDWILSEAGPNANSDCGLVMVVTGERGLDDLRDREEDGIKCFAPLSNMTWQDYLQWAREGYHFGWFDERLAQGLHDKMDTQSFANWLRNTDTAINLGMPVAGVAALSQQ